MASHRCPKCGTPVPASFAGWQILLSIFFFPFGLFSLLAGRRPGACPSCARDPEGSPPGVATHGASPDPAADEAGPVQSPHPVAGVLGLLATGLRTVDRTMRRLEGEGAVQTLENISGHVRREDPGGSRIILERSGAFGLWTWVFHNAGLIPIFVATGVLAWWLPVHGVELGMKVDAGLVWFLRGACLISSAFWVLGLVFGQEWRGSRRVTIDRWAKTIELHEPPRRREVSYGSREQVRLDFVEGAASVSDGERWRPAVILDDAGTRRVLVASRFTYGFQGDADAAGEIMLREFRELL